jgi:hypothetical protein
MASKTKANDTKPKAKAKSKSKSKPNPKARAKPKSKTPAKSTSLWEIIERVNAKARGDLDDSIAAFEGEVAAIDDANLQAVEAAFEEAMDRANHWDLWAAAYLIHGSISDDMFDDVRAGLVCLGRDRFEAALADPDSLARVKDVVTRTLFEGFQYVCADALEERDLESLHKPRRGDSKAGKKWDVKALQRGDKSALTARLPQLAKRFARA